MELNTNITDAREKKGWLMRELVAKIDIASVSKFEKGDRNPTRPQILRFARSH